MLIAFEGDRGSGKTLTMTKMGYIKHLQGRKIISNYTVNYPHIKLISQWLKDYLDKGVSNKESVTDCCILWDELPVYVDCRRSASKRNLLISYLVLQSRKRNVDIMYTTQSMDYVDKRFRKHTDVIVSPRHMINPKIGLLKEHGIFKIITRGTNYNGKDVERVDVWCLKEYFDFYDTNEIIYLDITE